MNYIDYSWLGVWNSMRLTNRTWKFEVEALFRAKYLPNMIIEVDSVKFKFKYTSAKRAIFEQVRKYGLLREHWEELTYRLKHRFSCYLIILPEVRTVNQTKLAGFQDDYKTRTFSIMWLPTISALFWEERRVHIFAREESERQFRKSFPNLNTSSRNVLHVPNQKDIIFHIWLFEKC